MSIEEVQRLVEELRIHQVELEIQNEELRDAQVELANSRDRYSDLYDFAPVGYVTLSRKGVILEANLTAANLLGTTREQLLQGKVSGFVTEDSQESWHFHRREVFSSGAKQICEVDMLRGDHTALTIQLQSIAFGERDGILTECRTALIDVTELRKAEAWKIEAQRLQKMVENLPAGAVYIDHEKLIINREAEEITGYQREELPTVDDWFEKLYPGKVEASRAVYEHLRSTFFQKCSPAIAITRKDGEERMVGFAAHRFDDHEVWLLRDQTDRIRAERALQRSQFAIDHIADAVLWVKEDGSILFANEAANTMFDYDSETMLKMNVTELDPLLTPRKWTKRWKTVKSKKDLFTLRELETSQGRTFHAELVATHLQFDDEEFICGIIHDITERREAELALASNEELLRAILNSTTDGIVTINDYGVILMANPAIAKMIGYEEGELVGLNVSMMMPPPYREEHDGYLQHYRETGEKRFIGSRREVSVQRKDGSTFPVDIAVSTVEGLNIFTGVIRDISQRKNLEKEVLNAVEKEIIRISAELHDGLGSALSGIKMEITVLLNRLIAGHSLEVESVDNISQKLGEAIRQSRLLAKGLQPVGPEPDALVPALNTLIEQLRSTHSCKAECRLQAPQTPLSISSPTVANQLYRIAQEAAHNAVKHSQATEMIVEVSVAGDHIILNVFDNGTGFDPSHVEAKGLGLHIMNYRARLAGGTLAIVPREGGGTEVRCVVPLK